MTDPVTNVEIEDVLSSIRRLVSADTRAETSKESDVDARPEGARDARLTEPRLVLTPAQRVDETQSVPEIEATEADQGDDPGTAAFRADVSESLEELDQEAEDQAQEAHEDVDATSLESEAQESPDHVAADPEETAEHSGEADAEERMDPNQIPQFLLREFPDTDTQEPDPDTAETVEAAVGEVVQDAYVLSGHETHRDEDAGSDSTFEPPEEQVADHSEDTDDAEHAIDPAIEDAEILEPENPDPASQATEPETVAEDLATKIETVEAAVAQQQDDWEPDGAGEDAFAGETVEPLPWHDIEAETLDMPQKEEVAHDQPVQVESAPVEAEASPVESAAELPQAQDQDDIDEEPSTWFDDDALLDEEALRDMVGEIVRQELQGVLGERITRNVRKLVRREIHRALMSKGIE